MSKKNSVLVSAAVWISELVGKLARALRELGVTDEEIGKLVDEKSDDKLLEKLTNLVVDFVERRMRTFCSHSGHIHVDYKTPIEQLVVDGKYCWSDKEITSENFRTIYFGEKTIKIEFKQFESKVSCRQAFKKIYKRGYRPAEAHELLAYKAKWPDTTDYIPIVALGSIWRKMFILPFAVYIYSEGNSEGKRHYAKLCNCWKGFPRSWQLLVVREESFNSDYLAIP